MSTHIRLNRQQATAQRRQSVLSAALDCFHEQGLEATTIQDIHRKANCSVGSLYHHFRSKEGIAEALWLSTIEEFNASMLECLSQATSGEQAVRAVVHGYCDWTVRNIKQAKFLHARDIEFSKGAKQAQHRLRQTYLEQVIDVYEPFVKSGEIAALPWHVYVPLISGPIEAYVRRWLAGDGPDPSAVEHLFAEAAWHAVKGQAHSDNE